MATILRTGKFLRYFAGFTRNVVVNSVRDTESSTLLQNTPCLCTQFQNGFANGAASPKQDLSLERQIKRLDKDVRRIGRISRRDIEDVLEEIRVARSATSSQSLLVIRCCGNLVPEELPEVRTALVQEIWKTLNALNIPMDISHYNALLRVYLENEHQFSPTDFLAQLESKSIEPNRVTYQRLIMRYCQEGDIDGATRILEHMREQGLPVNEAVFNSLILGHSQANDMDSAKGILTVMKQAGLEPSADTYATLLSCFGRHGDIESINSTLAECEKKEILLLDKDILDVIYHLTVNGHGDKIDGLLKKFHFSAGFNQDCVNTILKLTNKGFEDVCLKLLRIMPRGTRPDGTPVDVGIFFIKQLVKANRPMEKILSICQTLKDEGLNQRGLLIATETGLTHGLVNSTLPLLSAMNNAGLPIRQHYFWPLICSAEQNHIFDILRKMQEEFNLPPNSETIREYVIPNLKEKNWDKIITLLRDVGIANGTAASAASYAALSNAQIKEAANIMASYNFNYNFQLFRQPLIQAFGKTENYDAFVRCIRELYEDEQKKASQSKTDVAANAAENSEQVDQSPQAVSETEENVTKPQNDRHDVVGELLCDVASYFRNNHISILENLLPKMVQEGFTISNHNAVKLSEKIGSEMTPSISELLAKLSSGELELRALNNNSKKRSIDTLTVEELERFISNVEAKGENSNNLKRHLLAACFRSKNLEKTLQVMERLEAEKFGLGSGIFAQLIDLYASRGLIADALATYEKTKAKDPEFTLDYFKTINIVELLLKEERVEEALKFLEKNKKDQNFTDTDNNYNYNSKLWRILNSIADSGDADKLQKVFDAFVQGNYLVPNNVLLGPLIKVHLVKNNISKAIETFEKICDTYKSTPWKNELARRLIEAEDAANLQKVTDLSTNIHGEINSLYDLVFSFVECGRVRQARKILETPGLRTRPHRIETACERYKNEGMVEPLEGLIEATRDLSHIDRNNIYFSLLQSYEKSQDAQKALGLWTKMQEEDVPPSDDFLIKLAELLESKNMTVPFVVPQINKQADKKSKIEPAAKEAEDSVKKQTVTNPSMVNKSSSNLLLFRKSLNNNDVDAAINYKSKLSSSEQPSILDISHLIEQLVRADRLSEATKYVNELLAKKLYPNPKIFKFYLNRIANAGDLDTLQAIGTQLTDEQKRLVSFDNRYCHANIVAGKVEQYFKNLSDDLANAKSPEEVAKVAAKFPRGGALGILGKHPELVEQFEKLAESYAKHNHLGPMNILWIHHISNGNEAASKKIWDQHLSSAPRLMFQRVLQTARDQNNDKLAETVLSQLRESKISEGAIGNAYSCLIDIQTRNGKADQALQTLNTAVKDVCLEHINRTALQRLKSVLESENKEFPYTIPEKKANSNKSISSSSSSQSSDDDVTPKRPETKPTKPTQKSE